MSRILAIDYGKKRTGLAVTDVCQLIANGLTTVATHELLDFVVNYVTREDVETVVIGMPVQMNGQPSENQARVMQFIQKLEAKLPKTCNGTSVSPPCLLTKPSFKAESPKCADKRTKDWSMKSVPASSCNPTWTANNSEQPDCERP